MENKELLKNKRAFSLELFTKKALTTLAVAGFAFASAIGLVACKDTPPEDDNSTQTPPEDNGENENPPADTPTIPENPNPDTPETPPVETILTFDEFITKYPEEANRFALNQIEGLSYYGDSLSTNYCFVENDNKIQQILVANVVKTGDTQRELKIATINIVGGKDVQDIVDGKTDTIITIESETALSFDAKEEYKKGDTSTIETQIENLVQQHLGEQAIEISNYTPETFAPTTVAELVADYPEKVNEVLNEKCFDLATKKSYPLGFVLDNLNWARWHIDGDKKITSIQFVMDYHPSQTSGNIAATKLIIDNPISIEDFLQGNFSITKATREYYNGYNPSIQGTCDELMNAIFEHYGMGKECPEGAIRLFKDNGYQLDTLIGESNEFVVVQISNDNINQYSIRVKLSATDIDYIAKLNNSSNYKKSELQTALIHLNGYFVKYIPTNSTN